MAAHRLSAWRHDKYQQASIGMRDDIASKRDCAKREKAAWQPGSMAPAAPGKRHGAAACRRSSRHHQTGAKRNIIKLASNDQTSNQTHQMTLS